MFHLPWGPSIFEPDRSTGRTCERSSGTQGSRVNMESGGPCDCLSLCFFVYVFLKNKKRKYGEKRGVEKGAARSLWLVPVAVRLCAAGLFLSLGPIRDHKAYHDGSVYIYQQNTEQKAQTRLCAQQSTPPKPKGVLRHYKMTIHTLGLVVSRLLDLVELTFIILVQQASEYLNKIAVT